MPSSTYYAVLLALVLGINLEKQRYNGSTILD